MAKCPKCGGGGGVMLFTSIAPCDPCMSPQKYAVNPNYGDKLTVEVVKANYAPATVATWVARACAPGVNPAAWHGWKHPDGWRVWTLDEPYGVNGFTQAMTATWDPGRLQPELMVGAIYRWSALSGKIQEWRNGLANTYAKMVYGARDYFGIALK